MKTFDVQPIGIERPASAGNVATFLTALRDTSDYIAADRMLASRMSDRIAATSEANRRSALFAMYIANSTRGKGGKPDDLGFNCTSPVGMTSGVRVVIPSPALIADHRPARLGLWNTIRDSIPAPSIAVCAAPRNRHGGSKVTSGTGCDRRTRQPGGPIQMIGKAIRQ